MFEFRAAILAKYRIWQVLMPTLQALHSYTLLPMRRSARHCGRSRGLLYTGIMIEMQNEVLRIL
jgi:hypothetical protein